MKISVLKDFGIFDVGSRVNVQKLCNLINITSNELTLDLSRCIIDYPATSIIIDKIISDLTGKNGRKAVGIITNLNINELLLLHWLFIGSTFFDIDDSAKKSLSDFKKVINERLGSVEIRLSIMITDKNEQIIHAYHYGS